MERDAMNLEELRELGVAIPFTPFDILLKNGTRLHVIRPHQILAPEVWNYFIFSDERGSGRNLRIPRVELAGWEICHLGKAS